MMVAHTSSTTARVEERRAPIFLPRGSDVQGLRVEGPFRTSTDLKYATEKAIRVHRYLFAVVYFKYDTFDRLKVSKPFESRT
jgi:hypothetical protein